MKSFVVAIGVFAMSAGLAVAAPTVQKQIQRGQRLDPAFVTPEYFIDGVWVEGQTIPYSAWQSRDIPCDRRVVFDGDYQADHGNGIDPCSGAGYLFTSTTDTTSATLYDVRAALMVNDYEAMDPFGAGKEISGFTWNWHQFGDEPTLRIRFRWYDRCNMTNSTSFGTGGTGTVAGGMRMGVIFSYNGNVPAGDWQSSFDQDPPLFAPGTGFLDTDGGVVISAETTSGVQSPVIQFRLQGVRGTSTHPGVSVPYMWIDDSGELGRVSATHPYNIAAAIANYAIQITGTAETGNETYQPMDPACFASGLGPAMSWWVKDCCPVQEATLASPANHALGVTNPVTFAFSPPASLPVDFNVNVKLNGHNQAASVQHVNLATVTLASNLDNGRSYGWSVTSNAAGACPGAESATWTFRMGGCPADFNLDFSVDFFDYLDFVNAMSTNDDLADFNADQIVDFFDYLDFVDAFSTGC